MSASKDCRRIENELALFVGGELAARDRARLHEHLAACAECSELVERLRCARAALRAGLLREDEHVPDLWPGVRARLDLRPVAVQPAPVLPPAFEVASARGWRRWVPLSAAAAAVFAFGLWMGHENSPRTGSVTRQPELAEGGVHRPALPTHSVGLRRLAPEETPLSLTPGAGGVDGPLEDASWLRPTPTGGTQAASLRSRPPGYH